MEDGPACHDPKNDGSVFIVLIGAEGGGPGPNCGVAAFIEVEFRIPGPSRSSDGSIVVASIGVEYGGPGSNGNEEVVAFVGLKDGVACPGPGPNINEEVVAFVGLKDCVACPGPNCDGKDVVTLIGAEGGGPG